MVVGVRAALGEGKAYSYRDLQALLGLSGARFVAALDALVAHGSVRPVLASDARFAHGSVFGPFEQDLLWHVVPRAVREACVRAGATALRVPGERGEDQ